MNDGLKTMLRICFHVLLLGLLETVVFFVSDWYRDGDMEYSLYWMAMAMLVYIVFAMPRQANSEPVENITATGLYTEMKSSFHNLSLVGWIYLIVTVSLSIMIVYALWQDDSPYPRHCDMP